METILIEDIKDFHLFYQASGFVEGLIVTGYFIYPDLHKGNVFTFVEIGDGIYGVVLTPDNLDPLVAEKPTLIDLMKKYGLVLKENGVAKKFQAFGFSAKGSEI